MINPCPRLLANFDYKAKQFADFYDLDSDNFDVEQQKISTTFDRISKKILGKYYSRRC